MAKSSHQKPTAAELELQLQRTESELNRITAAMYFFMGILVSIAFNLFTDVVDHMSEQRGEHAYRIYAFCVEIGTLLLVLVLIWLLVIRPEHLKKDRK